MDQIHLCESEYRFLCVLWDHGPLASGELVTRCSEELGWKKSTTYTVLRKLCERGLAKNDSSLVSVQVPKSQVSRQQSRQFVEQRFNGSLPGFLTAFLAGKPVSPREAAEIRQILDRYLPSEQEEGEGGE